MDTKMMRAETLAFYRKLKDLQVVVDDLLQDAPIIQQTDEKEFIHIFKELTEVLHKIDAVHQQMIPRAEFMVEHKNETMRKLRKDALRLVK